MAGSRPRGPALTHLGLGVVVGGILVANTLCGIAFAAAGLQEHGGSVVAPETG